MLAPVSNGRRDKGSSFTKLKTYLTKEKDPETGKEIDRGIVVLSDNLLSLETADLEMMGVAGENKINTDAVYHFQIAWRPGEHPTREQWERAAKVALAELGLAEHQYLIAAHDDKAHFHVHIMVNKIHPETYRAHTPYRDMFTLDKTMRELETAQGWSQSVGLYRWDIEQGKAVKNTREEMDALSGKTDRAKGRAATIEHYHDIPSLQLYVKQKATLEVQGLLARSRVEWKDVHRALAKYGLELQKAEQGGYTVQASGTELRCKASDVFRKSFAGKANREATEKKLGPWQAATADDKLRPISATRYEKRVEATAKRQAQREEREQARAMLKKRFGAYRTGLRAEQKTFTEIVKVKRNMIATTLKEAKKAIRAEDIPWKAKRAKLSQVVAQSVTAQRRLKVEAMRGRLEQRGLTYQAWVIREAQAGDLAAASQLRGWRYTDQRNINKAEVLMSSQMDAIHLSSGEKDKGSDYAEMMNSHLKELLRNEELAKSLEASRWTINRRTGDVHYTVRGVLALVDRGKTISVLNSEESAIVLGLEMAVKKYGSTLQAEGSQQWKDRVARIAAKNGVYVEFSDSSMRHTMFVEQLRLDKYGVMAKQLSDLHVRVAENPQAPFQLVDVDAAYVFMSGMSGLGRGRAQVDELHIALKAGASQKVNVKGIFTLEARLGPDGKMPIFIAIPLEGKGVQLANMLKAGSAQMAKLAEVERNSGSSQVQKKRERWRDTGR